MKGYVIRTKKKEVKGFNESISVFAIDRKSSDKISGVECTVARSRVLNNSTKDFEWSDWGIDFEFISEKRMSEKDIDAISALLNTSIRVLREQKRKDC